MSSGIYCCDMDIGPIPEGINRSTQIIRQGNKEWAMAKEDERD
jgi:hypothetical protein